MNKIIQNTLLFILFIVCIYNILKPTEKYILRCSSNSYERLNIKFSLGETKRIDISNVSITSYNNKVEQCDDTPNIMASNRLVYEGAVAISRDLKRKYQIKYGDLVYIKILDSFFVIEDTMNERIKNTIDVFKFDKKESLKINFKNQDIIIYKVKR
jgi:3D (Asp-Asp-Asp) domain-containing protein